MSEAYESSHINKTHSFHCGACNYSAEVVTSKRPEQIKCPKCAKEGEEHPTGSMADALKGPSDAIGDFDAATNKVFPDSDRGNAVDVNAKNLCLTWDYCPDDSDETFDAEAHIMRNGIGAVSGVNFCFGSIDDTVIDFTIDGAADQLLEVFEGVCALIRNQTNKLKG
jgi:hypothetical protein